MCTTSACKSIAAAARFRQARRSSSAVIPNFVIHELHASALIDDNIQLCTKDYAAKGGYFEVPEAPGIGQELTDRALHNAEIVVVS